MDSLVNGEILLALLTLTVLEIVLGIDNIIFISILAAKLPTEQQKSARILGLSMAMVTRIALLLSLSWIMTLTKPLFAVHGHEVSGRDLILFGGGLFLIAKSTHEIHEKVRNVSLHQNSVQVNKPPSYIAALIQIALLDMVFSLDSVITAVGMVNEIWIMVTAIVISVVVMMLFSTWVSDFIDKNPTIKILALSFLLLIGVVLTAEGLGQEISKGYIYFAMAFSAFIEFVNMKMRKTEEPVDSAKLPP
ncbi:MAG: TerC family protein [Leptolyngbya sp.]|nr:TerC family protein [Candidatus Melainabacteria bacterium]